MNAADFGDGVVPTVQDIAAGDDLETCLGTIASTPGNYMINLTGSHSIGSGGSSVDLTTSGVKVSLRGTGTINLDDADYLFYIASGVELIIRGPTLQGKSGATLYLVFIDGGLTLHTGTITGHENTGGNGGGVFVNNGTFTMKGGTISGNSGQKGGGVYVDTSSGGTFTKTGGTIYGDTDTTNTPPENTATDGANGKGHAVYVYVDGSSGDLYRDTTAGPGVNLDSSTTDNWGQ